MERRKVKHNEEHNEMCASTNSITAPNSTVTGGMLKGSKVREMHT